MIHQGEGIFRFEEIFLRAYAVSVSRRRVFSEKIMGRLADILQYRDAVAVYVLVLVPEVFADRAYALGVSVLDKLVCQRSVRDFVPPVLHAGQSFEYGYVSILGYGS